MCRELGESVTSGPGDSVTSPNRLLLEFGLKGAGKGSIADWLIENGYFSSKLDIGALVRHRLAFIAGKSANDAAKAGASQLVGSEFVDPAAEAFLRDWEKGQAKIIDGFCRREEQAWKLLLWLCQNRTELGLDVKPAILMLKLSVNSADERRISRGRELNRNDDLEAGSRENGVREFENFTLPAIGILRRNGIPYVEVSSETEVPKDDPDYKKKSIAIVGNRVLAELKKIEFI